MKILMFLLFSFVSIASGTAQDIHAKMDTLFKDSIQLDSVSRDSVYFLKVKGTYYASKFHGRRTTSGEIFSNKKMTAAHLTLPFGTLVTVTNILNGLSVIVRINDRGPHSKVFKIDLSQAAAKKIGFFTQGVGNLEIKYSLPKKRLISAKG